MRSPLRWLNLPPAGDFVVRPHVDSHPFYTGDPASNGMRRLALLDTETTGLEPTAPIIEIAVRQLAYDPASSTLHGTTDQYTALQDPGVPIPDDIASLTGITSEVARGHRIDVARLRSILYSSDVVIAHNAEFDRPKVDALVGGTNMPWACSMSMIDWKGHGLPSTALNALCIAHGFYTTSHRATSDVSALTRLLMTSNAETGRTYFAELFDEARKPVVCVYAVGSPIEMKDLLKVYGYRWDAHANVWSRVVPAADAEAECEWLRTVAETRDPRVVRIENRTRFSGEPGLIVVRSAPRRRKRT